jgi:hypothetical protein
VLFRRVGALLVGVIVIGLVIALQVAGHFIAALNFFDRYTPQFFALFALGMLAVAMSRYSTRLFGWISGILFGSSCLSGPSLDRRPS